jgi:hypothetical protein
MEEQEQIQQTEEVADPRETPAFRGVLKQLESERAKAAQLESKLNELLDNQKSAEQKAKQAELESKGKYEEALAQTQQQWESKLNEMEQQIAEKEKALVLSNLKSELAMRGVTNKVVVSGIASEFFAADDQSDVSAWVEEFAQSEEHASLFSGERVKAPVPSGDFGSASGKPKTLEQRLASDDPAVARAARIEALKQAYNGG